MKQSVTPAVRRVQAVQARVWPVVEVASRVRVRVQASARGAAVAPD